MPETVTADQLGQVATDLDSMAASLDEFMGSIGHIINGTRPDVDSVFRHWVGPRADAALEAIGNYFDAVDAALPAIQDQIDVVKAMARFARQLEGELRAMEQQWANNMAALSTPLIDDAHSNDRIEQGRADARAAQEAIIEISARWVYARDQWCDWSLPPGNDKLTACRDEVLAPIEGMPYLHGRAYLERLGRFSENTGISLEIIDRSSRLAAEDWRRVPNDFAGQSEVLIAGQSDTYSFGPSDCEDLADRWPDD